ncbi:MAG TPA: hypothetical protein PK069_09885 [Methanolinea sp.]|nr:hypothetical protein [Methanolinea sp.]
MDLPDRNLEILPLSGALRGGNVFFAAFHGSIEKKRHSTCRGLCSYGCPSCSTPDSRRGPAGSLSATLLLAIPGAWNPVIFYYLDGMYPINGFAGISHPGETGIEEGEVRIESIKKVWGTGDPGDPGSARSLLAVV